MEEEEKKGNDRADTAADLGASESQAKVHKIAELYCWRQKLYRKLLARIQKCIVGLRMHEKQLREEDATTKGPFEKREEKVTISKYLRCSKGRESFQRKDAHNNKALV